MNDLMVKEFPLSNRGRFFLYLSYLFSFLILVLGVYAYLNLPQKVAVHFDLHGNPDRYGSKTEILIISLVFFIISFIFSVFVQKRYALLKNFPYLINIPAFYLYAQKLSEDRKAYWVAQYFELLALIMFLTNFMLLILEYFIYIGGGSGKLSPWFNYFLIPYVVLLLVVTFTYLFSMYRKIKKEAELS